MLIPSVQCLQTLHSGPGLTYPVQPSTLQSTDEEQLRAHLKIRGQNIGVSNLHKPLHRNHLLGLTRLKDDIR